MPAEQRHWTIVEGMFVGPNPIINCGPLACHCCPFGVGPSELAHECLVLRQTPNLSLTEVKEILSSEATWRLWIELQDETPLMHSWKKPKRWKLNDVGGA